MTFILAAPCPYNTVGKGESSFPSPGGMEIIGFISSGLSSYQSSR
jgi:hypothetical protein